MNNVFNYLGLGLLASIMACLGTRWMIGYARQTGLLDNPNQRSSHTIPTPRGGGVAIVAVSALIWFGLGIWGSLTTPVIVCCCAALVIAILGYCDDRYDLSAALRFCTHLVAAMALVLSLPAIPPLELLGLRWDWGYVGAIVYVLYVVWYLNLFNFMDGIDGLAGLQAVYVTGVATIALAITQQETLGSVLLVLGAATLGFLRYNWSPAKIFMGDVGSGFLGFCLAGFSAIATTAGPLNVFFWLTLNGVFIVDATFTLLTRLLRRQPWSQAHRDHGYQHAAVWLKSHSKVTLLVAGINLFWLTPLAFAAVEFPALGVCFVVIGWLPLVMLNVRLKAGIPIDDSTHAAG